MTPERAIARENVVYSWGECAWTARDLAPRLVLVDGRTAIVARRCLSRAEILDLLHLVK